MAEQLESTPTSLMLSKLGLEKEQQLEALAESVSRYYWATRNIQRVDNHAFDISKNPYLIDIFDDDRQEVVVRKSSQTRLSMTVVMRFIHKIAKQGFNGIYYFPTDAALYPFMLSRFNRLVELNPKLQSLFGNADNTTVKQLGEAFAYFFGLKGKTQKESTPADCEVFDEYDLMSPNDVEIAKERMQDSPYKQLDIIGNPTIPDFGTDGEFNKSDMKFWTIKCEHCGEQNECDINSEKMPFPACIEQGFLACGRCRLKLNVLKGQWVPKHPGREVSGYFVSRLFVHNADYVKILERSKKGLNIANFYNRVLGLPWSDHQTKIDAAHVLKMCGFHTMWEKGDQCTAGIDVNPTAGHHVVISRKSSQKLRDIVYLGIKEKLDDTVGLLKDFGVKKFVIDGQPDPEGANRVIRALGGRGFRCYYSETQKNSYSWDDEEHKVSVNRTESMDASQRLLRDLLCTLPRRTPIVEDFADHCANVARIIETNEKTGIMTARYVQMGADRPDHFRHAFNYDAMCWYAGEAEPRPSSIVSLNGGDLYKSRSITSKNVSRLRVGWS